MDRRWREEGFWWDIPVSFLIRAVTLRHVNCSGGTGMLVSRKALNGFGNHRKGRSRGGEGQIIKPPPPNAHPGFFVSGCDCNCTVSRSDEASPALCCENVRGGNRYSFSCTVHTVKVGWARPAPPPQFTPAPPCWKDAALPVTVRGKEAGGPLRSGSGRLDAEAVLAVGKAVWNTVVLLNFLWACWTNPPLDPTRPLLGCLFCFVLSHSAGGTK